MWLDSCWCMLVVAVGDVAAPNVAALASLHRESQLS